MDYLDFATEIAREQFSNDLILSYTVRRPGCTAWSQDHSTKREALRAAADALQVTGLRHSVYAEHESAKTSGPYLSE